MNEYNKYIQSLINTNGPISLEKRIIANGSIQVTAYDSNGRYIQHVSQKIIPQVVFDALPIREDFTTKNPPCIVCGELGTELHHWAPRHIFDDADLWPKNYLCRSHHGEWHRKISNHYYMSI